MELQCIKDKGKLLPFQFTSVTLIGISGTNLSADSVPRTDTPPPPPMKKCVKSSYHLVKRHQTLFNGNHMISFVYTLLEEHIMN